MAGSKKPNKRSARSKAFNPALGALKNISLHEADDTSSDKTHKSSHNPAGGRESDLSNPKDENIFASAMADVQPLRPRIERLEPSKTKESQAPADEELALAEFKAFASGSGGFEIEDTGEITWGKVDGVNASIMRKLKRGQFSFSRHLDLHGARREEAKALLQEFIKSSHGRGERCVLVITGRGLTSPDGVSVLRQSLPRWLSRQPLSGSVIAFCTAQRRDGGPGAFYVLLKKLGRGA